MKKFTITEITDIQNSSLDRLLSTGEVEDGSSNC